MTKKKTRSTMHLALAATAAGFIIGSVGYAVAGQDWIEGVNITKSGTNIIASGSVHDARFGGGAKDYIGCLSQWGANWVECHAQQTLSTGAVRTAVCAITNIG